MIRLLLEVGRRTWLVSLKIARSDGKEGGPGQYYWFWSNGNILLSKWLHSSLEIIPPKDYPKLVTWEAVSGWFWAGWDCVRQLLFARPLNTPPPSPPRPVSPIYNKVGASHHCRVSDTHNKVQFHKVYWHTEHSTQLQSGGGRLNRICVSGAGNQLSVK